MASNLPTSDALLALKGIESQLAFDDFVTGYPSMHFVHACPIATYEVNQSLVRDHPSDEFYDGVAAAVSKARKSRHVISSVVETCEPSEFLDQHGYCESQGVLLAQSAGGRPGRRVVSRHLRIGPRGA